MTPDARGRSRPRPAVSPALGAAGCGGAARATAAGFERALHSVREVTAGEPDAIEALGVPAVPITRPA